MSRLQLPLKTYSHLQGGKKMPSDYEIVTSKLLYYVNRGFEVDQPIRVWYDRFQAGSPLACRDWEAFRDPRETTYTKYVGLQARQETHVAALFASLEKDGFDDKMDPAWRDRLERVLGPLRFALHGLQMLAAYVGQMAPSGRITLTAMFQAGDELRRVHGIAYRLAQLRRRHPGIAEGSRQAWQSVASWQPLRKWIETAFTVYDWGESLTALNVCLKPFADALFMSEVGRLAREHDDYYLAEILSSFDADCRWHREWTAALLATAFADRAENRAVVQGWVGGHFARARDAVCAAAELLDGGDEVRGRLESAARAWLTSCGLEAP